jgi:hypothetical protein
MSEQPSPVSSTDTAKKAEFGGINLLIGFVIGAALQFGWWALLDRLELRNTQSGNTDFLTQVLAVIGQANWPGFLIGATLGATSNSASVPIRSVIGKSIRWALGFSLAFYCFEVVRLLLQTTLGESLGDIVTSAFWFGLAGSFVGLVLELQRTVAPNIGTAPLSLRQCARWALAVDRSAVPRMLIVALLGALVGITIEILFQRSNAWPLMLLLDAIVAGIAIRLWRPSRTTLRKWAIGALALIIIIGLLLLLDLSAQLGVIAGIVVLVGYAILQSRK